jgi:hypothetical protein
MLASCSKYQESRSRSSKLDPIPHEIPLYPYQEIGTDMFELQGQRYLLIITGKENG